MYAIVRSFHGIKSLRVNALFAVALGCVLLGSSAVCFAQTAVADDNGTNKVRAGGVKQISAQVSMVQAVAQRHIPRPPLHIIKLQNGGAAPVAPFAIAGAHASYFGGPVISNVHVVQVLYGVGAYLPNIAGTATPTLGQFFTDITQSSFMDMLSEYTTAGILAADGTPGSNQTIGHGFFDGVFTITPAAADNGITITDAQIQTELLNQVSAGKLPAPVIDGQGNNNTLYMIYFPPGKTITAGGSSSCVNNGFCAYHNSTDSSFASHRLYYGVLPDVQPPSGCSLGCGGGTLFDIVTNVSSHEFSEAVTDPDVGPATSFSRPLAWIDPVNDEIGDICVGQEASVVANNTTYTVQQEFSNLRNDCAADPPNFQITAGPDVVSGQSFDLALRAVQAYNGTVHFTSSDPAAVLPSDYAFTFADAGTHNFVATLKSSGSQTITVTDTKLPGFHGSATLGVNVPNVAELRIAAPQSAPLGTAVTVAITALDSTQTLVPNYTGKIHLSSTDPLAILPPDTTLTNGTGTFTITLNTAGIQTLQAADTAVAAIKGSAIMTGIAGSTNATTTTLTPCATPLVFGQSCNFVVAVAATGVTTVSGTFNVTVDGQGVLEGGIFGSSNAPVSASGGTHTVYANFLGDGTLLPSSSGPVTLVVNPAPNTLSVTASQSSAQFGVPVTFTAQTTPFGASRGFVTFFDGANALGIIPASQAFVPGLTVTALPVGSHSITASFSGSPDFLPSTSSAIVEAISPATAPDFSLKATTPSATVSAGQTATFQIMTASLSGFAGNVSFSCGTLPSLTSCTFSPPVTFVSGTVLTSITVLSIKTTAGRALLINPASSVEKGTVAIWWAMSPFGIGLIIATSARWRRKRGGLLLGFAVLMVSATLMSCGGGNPPPPPPPVPATPAGTTTVTVNATGVAASGAAPANPKQQLTLNLTVQ